MNQVVGRRELDRHVHCFDIDRRFGKLERRFKVQDRSDRLTRHHTASTEAAPITNAVDLVANGFVMITAANEVRAQRVRRKYGI